MSVMRTYYSWRFVESLDKSYLSGPFGIWCAAELSVGIIVGCLPVMPKFYQHIAPKVMLSLQSESASNPDHDLRNRSKTFTTSTLTKSKSFFFKHSSGLSTSELNNNPHSQLHGEYYTMNYFEEFQRQAKIVCGLTQVPEVEIATRRDDFKYGDRGS